MPNRPMPAATTEPPESSLDGATVDRDATARDATSADGSLLPATRRALDTRLAKAQAADRMPSVVAGLVREGALVWSARRGATVEAAGVTGDGDPVDTQYRIGSITKTFTAVLVMRLRDEGRLDLSDPLETYVPKTGLGDRRVGDLLSHVAGVSAEPAGAWWERSVGGDFDDLRGRLGSPAPRQVSGARFHYSNVGFALLGQVVAAVRGTSWEETLREEILAPLGMTRTARVPHGHAARGFAVHPWADVLLPEPATEQGAMAPAGELWSTVADLARWARFLSGDTGDVLSADTLAEMAAPRGFDDNVAASGGYGLGLQIIDIDDETRGTRRLVGHFGSVPGFQASLFTDRDTGDCVVTLLNGTTGGRGLAIGLLRTLAAHEPHQPAAWTPGPTLPEETLEILGVWFWGPAPHVLRARGADALDLTPLGDGGRPARFRRDAAGDFVGVNGYYTGEPLRVVRRADGGVGRLDIATFHFTRGPYDPADMVPSGFDPAGWHGRQAEWAAPDVTEA